MSKLIGVLFLFAVLVFNPVFAQPGVPQNLEFSILFNTDDENKLKMPLGIEEIPTRPGTFLAYQKTGEVVLLRDTPDGPEATTLVTILVNYPGAYEHEYGLLGLAFHPQFSLNRLYYISYMADPIDEEQLIIEERRMGEDFASDEGHALNIITIEQSLNNHNAGTIGFGPDGMLYISVGDGGQQGDPYNRGQTLSTLMGKMLRINVDDKTGDTNYKIPADNPFVNVPEVRPEIWAYGLRNPWKWSFDRLTGELWVGDVGYLDWEEVSIVPKGGNMGWKIYEGYSCLESDLCETEGLTEPITIFDREKSTSLTGGVVFRGNPDSPLYGTYFCADYGYAGRQGSIWVVVKDGMGGYDKYKVSSEVDDITSFNMDRAGNIYVISQQGMVYKMEHPDLVPVSINPFNMNYSNFGRTKSLFGKSPLLSQEILSQSWKLYSSNGKFLGKLHSENSWNTIASSLEQGLYFVSIEGQNFSYSLKWIIP